MGAEASYDAQIFESKLEERILTLGTLETLEARPELYTDTASDGVYSLLARDFAPLPDAGALAGRARSRSRACCKRRRRT
jgi:hypothetical protein